MKYASKHELVERVEAEHATFVALLESVPGRDHREAGVWGDGWTVHDLVAHLLAWEQMLLSWHRAERAGETPELPAPGYTWNQTPALNRAIQAMHRDRAVDVVRAEFDASYVEVLASVRGLSEDELFTPGRFAWTSKNALVTYVGSNTVSHYRTASKILRRWSRARR